ncbi:unnamed protein product [Leptidea sinapis]|uniref:TLDc domain-containing protein n=1 Tax=Leptidea sinapis TaxID=189913 RepID=A0A5E4Q209_9NEOP|nr:unnamed protein product [Leptidea sinapis]
MGNTSKKLAAKCTLLTRDEQKYVAATFRAASKNSEKIREEELIKFWSPQIDPRLAQYLSNYLFGSGADKLTTVDFNRFAELYVLQTNILFKQLEELVFVNLYGINKRGGDESPSPLPPAPVTLLPAPDGRIQEQGPSVLIIEDNNGYIFGGFATASWSFSPNWTGIMGGQLEFGGIWVPAEPFGEGSSAESCSTYKGYKRLSKEPHFHIRSIEVWGVGDKPSVDKDMDERDVSILDGNPDAKAILDMAGRTRHSEGLLNQEVIYK